MLTLYTCVKPFLGGFARMQWNAIQSWLRLEPRPEVLLFGANESRAWAYAEELDVPLFPVERDELGTPLLRSIIQQAEAQATHEIRCYLNADIILLPGFIDAVRQAAERFPRFLLSAQRWDLDVEHWLDFEPGWDVALKAEAKLRGVLHRKTGIDVFCYRGDFWGDVPGLLIGRRLWDGWMAWHALQEGATLLDVTPVATVVHQNHPHNRNNPAVEWSEAQYEANRAIYQVTVGRDARPGKGGKASFAFFPRSVWRLQPDGWELTRYGRRRGYGKEES